MPRRITGPGTRLFDRGAMRPTYQSSFAGPAGSGKRLVSHADFIHSFAEFVKGLFSRGGQRLGGFAIGIPDLRRPPGAGECVGWGNKKKGGREPSARATPPGLGAARGGFRAASKQRRRDGRNIIVIIDSFRRWLDGEE